MGPPHRPMRPQMIAFCGWPQQAPGCISIERSTLGLAAEWSPPPPPAADLLAARFDRHLDLRWRRTSYSDITAGAHDPLVATEPEEPVLGDEPETPAPVGFGGFGALGEGGLFVPGLDRPSVLGDMPVGRGVRDARASRVRGDRLRRCRSRRRARRHVSPLRRRGARSTSGRESAGRRASRRDRDAAGGGGGGLRLRDVGRVDRLDELEFELPLVGGDDPSGRLTLAPIAEVLRGHCPRR